MSNLIPEVRVNKNGVPVTKHVRPANAGGKGKSVPAPKVKTKSYSYELRSQIRDHVYAAHEHGLSGFTELGSIAEIMPWRNSLSDATLEAYLETIHARPDDAFDDMLLGVFKDQITDDEACYYLEIAKTDHTQYLSGLSADEKWGCGAGAYRRAASVYRGLESYEGSVYQRPVNILDQSDPVVEATKGLFRVTHRLCTGEGTGLDSFFRRNADSPYGQDHVMRLAPRSLPELVVARPEDADRIADIILARDVTDTDTIVAVLDAEVSQLSSGIL
jgi:hypothetical protein